MPQHTPQHTTPHHTTQVFADNAEMLDLVTDVIVERFVALIRTTGSLSTYSLLLTTFTYYLLFTSQSVVRSK